MIAVWDPGDGGADVLGDLRDRHVHHGSLSSVMRNWAVASVNRTRPAAPPVLRAIRHRLLRDHARSPDDWSRSTTSGLLSATSPQVGSVLRTARAGGGLRVEGRADTANLGQAARPEPAFEQFARSVEPCALSPEGHGASPEDDGTHTVGGGGVLPHPPGRAGRRGCAGSSPCGAVGAYQPPADHLVERDQGAGSVTVPDGGRRDAGDPPEEGAPGLLGQRHGPVEVDQGDRRCCSISIPRRGRWTPSGRDPGTRRTSPLPRLEPPPRASS